MNESKEQKFNPSKLNKVMHDRGVSVSKLHEETKIPITTLYDWTNGRVVPRVDGIKKIASFLGVSMEELIE